MNLKSQKLLKVLSIIIFSIYVALLIWIIVFKCNYIQSFTETYIFLKDKKFFERISVYFVLPKDYFSNFFNRRLLNDEILNMIVFIPMGLYLSYLIKNKKILRSLIISLLFTISFEVFQLCTMIGAFSIKDLVANFLGSMIGCLIYKLLILKRVSDLKIKILNIISIVIIVIFIPVLFYAIINTIRCADLYIDILLRRLFI